MAKKAFDTWTVLDHRPIEKLSENLWSVTGDLPNMSLKRVMVLARLQDGGLLVHNAMALEEEAMQEIRNFGENADLKQAVADLGVEYGLVTDYTAMVVVHDEVFEELGIKRANGSRRALEEAARQLRNDRPADTLQRGLRLAR